MRNSVETQIFQDSEKTRPALLFLTGGLLDISGKSLSQSNLRSFHFISLKLRIVVMSSSRQTKQLITLLAAIS